MPELSISVIGGFLDDGAIKLEISENTRTCKCGRKIPKGEKHLAIYQSQGKWTPKRTNFCKYNCATKLLIVAQSRLSHYETELFGSQGG